MNAPRFAQLLMFLAVGHCFTAGEVSASPRQGISFGLGLGGMSAERTDSDEYGWYPDIQLAYDIGPLKFELHAGSIWDNHDGQKIEFMPVEFDMCLLPGRLFWNLNSEWQLLLGIGVGKLWGTGRDNDGLDETLFPVYRLGIDYYAGEYGVIGYELAWHYVTHENSEVYRDPFVSLILTYQSACRL